MANQFQIRGVEKRAQDLKSAASRLRWEIDYILGVVPGRKEEMGIHERSDLINAQYHLAEAMGILKNVLDTMDREVQEPSLRKRMLDSFNNHFNFFKDFHRIAR
jgi:hypothetical protein